MKNSATLRDIVGVLHKNADSVRAKGSMQYFKTGPGEYGQGDQFLGIRVPEQRSIAKTFFNRADLADVRNLLHSTIHEYRFVALEILVFKYRQAVKEGDKEAQKKVVDFYLKQHEWVNNWDLVDTSAHQILGSYLVGQKAQDRKILVDLAKSEILWQRRISMIACFAFIKRGDVDLALKIAKIHLKDGHDLMHKAVGWMLREIGKKNESRLDDFLIKNYQNIPRTTLRYAIERMKKTKRKQFLMKNF